MGVKESVKKLIPPFIMNLYYYWYQEAVYELNKNKTPFRVASRDETLDRILRDGCSMVRFGDGEMDIIDGHYIGYQEYNADLARRMKEVLQSPEEDKLLMCIPGVFDGLKNYTRKTRHFWVEHLYRSKSSWENCCKRKYYYNTQVTHPYLEAKNKKPVAAFFKKFKEVWEGRNVILIEGNYSRLGCGNDLFDNVKSLKRIICPAKNAYDKYAEIYGKTLSLLASQPPSLVLVALGPTAKPLTFDLYKAGFWVLDVGNVDIEYEWFLHNINGWVQVENKWTHCAPGGNKNLDNFKDEKYEGEIIADMS